MPGKRISILFQLFTFLLLAQPHTASGSPRTRINRDIIDDDRVTLMGDRHPLARPENEAGVPPTDLRLDRMILTLLPDPEESQALADLIVDQQNPQSPRYHQ